MTALSPSRTSCSLNWCPRCAQTGPQGEIRRPPASIRAAFTACRRAVPPALLMWMKCTANWKGGVDFRAALRARFDQARAPAELAAEELGEAGVRLRVPLLQLGARLQAHLAVGGPVPRLLLRPRLSRGCGRG